MMTMFWTPKRHKAVIESDPALSQYREVDVIERDRSVCVMS